MWFWNSQFSISPNTLNPQNHSYKLKVNFVFSHILQSWRSTRFMDIDFPCTNIGGCGFISLRFSWQKQAQIPMLFHSFSSYSWSPISQIHQKLGNYFCITTLVFHYKNHRRPTTWGCSIKLPLIPNLVPQSQLITMLLLLLLVVKRRRIDSFVPLLMKCPVVRTQNPIDDPNLELCRRVSSDFSMISW